MDPITFCADIGENTTECSGSILIVEDEEDLALLLEYNLKKEYYRVHMAGNGAEALRLAREELPDVILLDILLPGMSGWDVCRSIRMDEDEKVASIPIVMLTALRDECDKYRGLDLGADVFLKKPYAIREVLLHCRNLVRGRRRHLNLIRKCGTSQPDRKEDIYRILFHELKNQLTIIGGLTGSLEKENRNAKERRFIKAIQLSTEYLENIASEAVVLEQLCGQRPASPGEPLPLEELVTGIIALISPLASRKNIRVHLISGENSFRFKQNRTALKIILVILLENAVKYSSSHSTVQIRLGTTGNRFLVAVADNGPGIRFEEQSKIFTRAYRGRTVKDSYSGTGLGLYIAKMLADSIEGVIDVHSRPGEGSTFTCTFPL
jgi:signal transduction histidine kinase